MTNNMHIMNEYIELYDPIPVKNSNGEHSNACGKGKLTPYCKPSIVIDNVLYVPDITKTLIRTNSLTEQGLTIVIGKKYLCQRPKRANSDQITTENGLTTSMTASYRKQIWPYVKNKHIQYSGTLPPNAWNTPLQLHKGLQSKKTSHSSVNLAHKEKCDDSHSQIKY